MLRDASLAYLPIERERITTRTIPSAMRAIVSFYTPATARHLQDRRSQPTLTACADHSACVKALLKYRTEGITSTDIVAS